MALLPLLLLLLLLVKDIDDRNDWKGGDLGCNDFTSANHDPDSNNALSMRHGVLTHDIGMCPAFGRHLTQGA